MTGVIWSDIKRLYFPCFPPHYKVMKPKNQSNSATSEEIILFPTILVFLLMVNVHKHSMASVVFYFLIHHLSIKCVTLSLWVSGSSPQRYPQTTKLILSHYAFFCKFSSIRKDLIKTICIFYPSPRAIYRIKLFVLNWCLRGFVIVAVRFPPLITN